VYESFEFPTRQEDLEQILGCVCSSCKYKLRQLWKQDAIYMIDFSALTVLLTVT